MTQYDDYFTDGDKPFAENLNDALLVSNVFDYSVDIELPKMFSNSTWIDNSSARKAGVSIITLLTLENLTIGTDSSTNKSILSCESSSGILEFKFYPNFNSFGKLKSIGWTADNDNITCRIRDKNNNIIINSVTNGEALDNINLNTLQEFKISFLFTGVDVLRDITINMENKQQTRYGANVKISNVDGLQTVIDGLEEDIDNLDTYNLSNFTMSGHSINGYYRNKNKIIVEAETTYLNKRDGTLFSTNINYPPLKNFNVPCIAYWEEDSVTKYGILMMILK